MSLGHTVFGSAKTDLGKPRNASFGKNRHKSAPGQDGVKGEPLFKFDVCLNGDYSVLGGRAPVGDAIQNMSNGRPLMLRRTKIPFGEGAKRGVGNRPAWTLTFSRKGRRSKATCARVDTTKSVHV